jgi:hypothetical protein
MEFYLHGLDQSLAAAGNVTLAGRFEKHCTQTILGKKTMA